MDELIFQILLLKYCVSRICVPIIAFVPKKIFSKSTLLLQTQWLRYIEPRTEAKMEGWYISPQSSYLYCSSIAFAYLRYRSSTDDYTLRTTPLNRKFSFAFAYALLLAMTLTLASLSMMSSQLLSSMMSDGT